MLWLRIRQQQHTGMHNGITITVYRLKATYRPTSVVVTSIESEKAYIMVLVMVVSVTRTF